MRVKPLADKLTEAKERLMASDQQMAKHMKLSFKRYKELESGAIILPLPAQKTIERRLKGLLDRCGLK